MDIVNELWEQLNKKGLSEHIDFLQESNELLIYYLNECKSVIVGTDTESIIRCRNSYERRIVHTIADAFGLYHIRYGAWDPEYKHHLDKECLCRYCWKTVGEKYYRIRGVKISTIPFK